MPFDRTSPSVMDAIDHSGSSYEGIIAVGKYLGCLEQRSRSNTFDVIDSM